MTVLRTTTAALTFTLLIAGSALAGPPLATDDAGTVEVGKFEIELNGAYDYDRQNAGGSTTRTNTSDTELKLTTGLYKDLGISLAIPYTVNLRTNTDGAVSDLDGFGDMSLQLKYVFAELGGVRLAVKPSLLIPTGSYRKGLSEGRWQFGGTLIATKEFADGAYALHANLSYEHHAYRTEELRSTTRSNLFSASLAGEAEVAKGLFAVADVGLATNPDRGSHELPVYALTGARYQINEHLDINAGIKFGLTRPETDITALYGVVFKF